MKIQKSVVLLLLFLTSSSLFAQDKVSISGYMKDSKNGEVLIGATVAVKELSNVGSATNVYGYYSLSVPKGDYTLIYSYIGYNSQEKKVTLTANTKIDVELS
jgi:hypothetical protein